jgi:hypothetical protein
MVLRDIMSAQAEQIPTAGGYVKNILFVVRCRHFHEKYLYRRAFKKFNFKLFQYTEL